MMSREEAEKVANSLNYRHDGLVIAVAQEYLSGKVLMVAHMNKEAVIKTLTTGIVHYWSKSRKKLWMKGESSGHVQYLVRFYIDCDRDTLLLVVRQVGYACHEGFKSCFHYTAHGVDENGPRFD